MTKKNHCYSVDHTKHCGGAVATEKGNYQVPGAGLPGGLVVNLVYTTKAGVKGSNSGRDIFVFQRDQQVGTFLYSRDTFIA